MKFFLMMILLLPFTLLAETRDKEGDLQLPVTDMNQVERQEQEVPPTLDEVPMYEKEPQKRTKAVDVDKVKKVSDPRSEDK